MWGGVYGHSWFVDPAGKKVRARRSAGEDIEEIEAPLPCFIVTDPGFTSTFRSATHRLKLVQLLDETAKRAATIDTVFKQWNAADLGADLKKIGLKGSPTIVNKVEPIPTAAKERTAKVVDAKNQKELEEVAKRIVQIVKGAP
jgi:electron transfer flavoprotein beta subunit